MSTIANTDPIPCKDWRSEYAIKRPESTNVVNIKTRIHIHQKNNHVITKLPHKTKIISNVSHFLTQKRKATYIDESTNPKMFQILPLNSVSPKVLPSTPLSPKGGICTCSSKNSSSFQLLKSSSAYFLEKTIL